jgi:hypothetical protein
MQIDDNQIYRILARVISDKLEIDLFGANPTQSSTGDLRVVRFDCPFCE